MMSTPWLKLSDIKTPRWSKANNGRTLPLNGAAWRVLRAAVLDDEPLCRHCAAMGLTVSATDVDHRDNDPANNAPQNLQALCHECHSRKTARDMGHNVRMGCDKDGMPLDIGHHWNRPAIAALLRPKPIPERSPATERLVPPVLPSFNANREIVL